MFTSSTMALFHTKKAPTDSYIYTYLSHTWRRGKERRLSLNYRPSFIFWPIRPFLGHRLRVPVCSFSYSYEW
uniref:Uncharacterized protein n=1 Tax=Utricularia reniformis TaxID=192314 RepID=A0A1Y0B1Q2_9LAMI|nr:hypothetical protein AEK19_MT1071 [Utricularia reniformis]ART31293.1 hypothetical protein AEK19_MT1071 [Utricularia reniformis]